MQYYKVTRACSVVILVCIILGMLTGCLNPSDKNSAYDISESDETTSTPPSVAPEAIEKETLVEIGFVTGVKLRVRSGPGADFEKIGELDTGTKVSFTDFQDAADGTWGKMELGWIFMDHVYIPGTVTNRQGFVVVKENGAAIYDAILQPRNSVKKLAAGDRYEILHYITFDGDERRGYTRQGWIDLRLVYLEGENGEKPCSGIVQDSTPLNVRSGPGTSYEIIGTLENGTSVSVKEQITCNNDTWGYNGNGWIAMSRVVRGTSNSDIVGSWVSIGVDDQYPSLYRFGTSYEFFSDGTVKGTGECVYYSYSANDGLVLSYDPFPSGSMDFYGTYEFTGNSLVMSTKLYNTDGTSNTYYKAMLNDDVLTLISDGNPDMHFYRIHNGESSQTVLERHFIK